MTRGKKLISLLLSLLFVFYINSTTHAKSVYVITEHEGNKLTAYDIQAEQINYQATATLPASAIKLPILTLRVLKAPAATERS